MSRFANYRKRAKKVLLILSALRQHLVIVESTPKATRQEYAMTEEVLGGHGPHLEDEETYDEIIDLEDYAKRGERPPKAKGYRFKVNDEAFVTTRPVLKGRDILEIAGLVPVDKYRLRLKLAGGKPEPIVLEIGRSNV